MNISDRRFFGHFLKQGHKIKYHIPMAKKLGATREEIKDTILITLTVSGLKGVVSCLPLALEEYDKTDTDPS